MTTDTPMELGMVGLGRMGAGIARRLMADGHRCVGYDRLPAAVDALAADGATPAYTIDELVSALSRRWPPRSNPATSSSTAATLTTGTTSAAPRRSGTAISTTSTAARAAACGDRSAASA